MGKAVFLDRDGVINIEKEYLYKIEEFEFIDGVFESAIYLQKLGYKLFIITNQSGIARGYYSLDEFNKLSTWMMDEFSKKGVKIEKLYFCPHGPNDNCSCRKPKTGMIDDALKEFDIDLAQSILIGDKISDIKCAKNAKIGLSVIVKSGHSFDEKEVNADFIIDSIKDIPNIIKE